MKNSIHVTPANNGYVVAVEGKDYNSETFVFATSEALIEAWPALLTREVELDSDFAEVDGVSKFATLGESDKWQVLPNAYNVAGHRRLLHRTRETGGTGDVPRRNGMDLTW